MPNPVRVLLVEDNPGDVELIRDALGAVEVPFEISVAVDGSDAVDRLFRIGIYAGFEVPNLILLDLNLPRMGGLEVLTEIKRDSLLKRIPVIVLTSSDAENDILSCYELGANCYVKKPMDLASFQSAVLAIETFWSTVVQLPGRRASA